MCVVKMRSLCDLHPRGWDSYRRALFEIITHLQMCFNSTFELGIMLLAICKAHTRWLHFHMPDPKCFMNKKIKTLTTYDLIDDRVLILRVRKKTEKHVKL